MVTNIIKCVKHGRIFLDLLWLSFLFFLVIFNEKTFFFSFSVIGDDIDSLGRYVYFSENIGHN